MYDRKDYYYDPVNHYYTYGGNTSTVSGDDGWYEPSASRETAKKKKKKFELTAGKLIALMLCMVLLAGGAGFGGAKLAGGGTITVKQEEQSVSNTGFDIEEATGSKMTVQQIAKKVSGSVVSIKTESVASSSWIREYVTEGAGSGVIISEDGYIMTNNHVVEGARKITVSIDESSDDDQTFEATLVGTDAANDVAVIKIDAKGLTAATIGKSDKLAAGDMAVVVGNPLGELGDSISAGIISSTSRKVTLENQEMNLIQTDASINPGNSGGGLFNGNAQLVGLVVAKSSGTDVEGLGFAIPINTAIKSAKNIIDGKIDDSKNQSNGNDQNTRDDQNDQYDNGFGNGNDNNDGNDRYNDSDDWEKWIDDFYNDNNGGGSLFDFFF